MAALSIAGPPALFTGMLMAEPFGYTLSLCVVLVGLRGGRDRRHALVAGARLFLGVVAVGALAGLAYASVRGFGYDHLKQTSSSSCSPPSQRSHRPQSSASRRRSRGRARESRPHSAGSSSR